MAGEYACSMAIDEFLALAYWRKSSSCDRCPLFNTVRRPPNRALRHGAAQFCNAVCETKPLRVFGTGEQSFAALPDVRDVVRALSDLVLSDRSVGEIFNVGNNKECTIKELAHKVRNQPGSRSPITYVPYDEATGWVRRYDASSARPFQN